LQRCRWHFAVNQQNLAGLIGFPFQEPCSGRQRIGQAEHHHCFAGASDAVKHHQALLWQDRAEQHFAGLDVEREKVCDTEWLKPGRFRWWRFL
jgi:hypothetical protein